MKIEPIKGIFSVGCLGRQNKNLQNKKQEQGQNSTFKKEEKKDNDDKPERLLDKRV